MTLLDVIPLFLTNLAIIMVVMVAAWGVSRAIGDVSFIDALWGLGFVIVAWVSFQVTRDVSSAPHKFALVTMATIWGLRLAVYLFVRWRAHGKDRRYVALLGENPKPLYSLMIVFVLQGILICFIAAPLYMGQIGQLPNELGVAAQIGIALWIVGFMFEAIGDHQLTRFKANPDNADKVLDTGLWRYTRHPNYFGDACVWWGMYLVAAESSLGIYAFPAPMFMTFILLKWSGVPLLERSIGERRPKYADYVARTSAFFPMPPKKKG